MINAFIKKQLYFFPLMVIITIFLTGCSTNLSFSAEKPLIQQLVPFLSTGMIRVINRLNLLAGVFLAAAGWEYLGVLQKLKWLLTTWSKLKKYIVISSRSTHATYYTNDIPMFTTMVRVSEDKGLIYNTKTGELVGEERISERKLPGLGYIIIAVLSVVLILSSQHNILYWLVYPFRQFWYGIQIWRYASINPWWTILSIIGKSIGYLLWSLLSFVLLYILGVLSMLRVSAAFASLISERLTRKTYSWILGFSFVLVAFIGFITY